MISPQTLAFSLEETTGCLDCIDVGANQRFYETYVGLIVIVFFGLSLFVTASAGTNRKFIWAVIAGEAILFFFGYTIMGRMLATIAPLDAISGQQKNVSITITALLLFFAMTAFFLAKKFFGLPRKYIFVVIQILVWLPALWVTSSLFQRAAP